MESISKEKTGSDKIQQLTVHRIYVKTNGFEAAAITNDLLPLLTNTQIEMQAQVNIHDRENDLKEAVLTIQLAGKLNGNFLYRLHVQQAGLYTLTGYNETERDLILNGVCINQLYPYACEAVCSMVIKAGIPAPVLAPMDFLRLYQQEQQQKSNVQVKTEGVH